MKRDNKKHRPEGQLDVLHRLLEMPLLGRYFFSPIVLGYLFVLFVYPFFVLLGRDPWWLKTQRILETWPIAVLPFAAAAAAHFLLKRGAQTEKDDSDPGAAKSEGSEKP